MKIGVGLVALGFLLLGRVSACRAEDRDPSHAPRCEINTWRSFEENISQAGIMEFVEQWEAKGYRFGGVTIDEGWTPPEAAFGDWTPDGRRFPDLRGLVDWLHAKGYRVRLWVAPLLVNEGSAAAKSLPSAYLLTGAGGARVRQVGRNALVLDPRVPGARQQIAAIMERLTREYNPDAYKIDFCLTKGDANQPSMYPNDNFDDRDRDNIQRALFQAIRAGCAAVKPGIRIESYPLESCADTIDDVISGDLIGSARTQASHEGLDRRLLQLARAHGWVTWPEMVWGLGSDTPTGNPDWDRTYLEWLATDINYERKLELSFPPFDYANAGQIRALMNLYASGGTTYKVLYAGRNAFDLGKLARAGVRLSVANRFLVAPSGDAEIRFVVPPGCGIPSQWEVIDLMNSESVRCVIRDENWEDGKAWHCVRFTARAGGVYVVRMRSP